MFENKHELDASKIMLFVIVYSDQYNIRADRVGDELVRDDNLMLKMRNYRLQKDFDPIQFGFKEQKRSLTDW